jgi:transcriptional regulator with XRE-family HTH domain
MDVCMVIRQRLEELGLEQRDLAKAAEVTESYISQLLTRKKLPPAPERTDIYEKMSRILKLPPGKLSELATHIRELILRKCLPDTQKEVREIFEKQPFGELERLVTQRLLDVVKRVAKAELENREWLQQVARLSGRSYEEMRVGILEFLDTDVFNLSGKKCAAFLEPMIEFWNIDLATFTMETKLNRGEVAKFEFVEKEAYQFEEELGLNEFLQDPALRGDATGEEIEFLKKLRFKYRRPAALYYYRELQNLRDPLNFRGGTSQRLSQTKPTGQAQPTGSVAPMHRYQEAIGIEKQMQSDARKNALQRWDNRRGKKQKPKSGKKRRKASGTA